MHDNASVALSGTFQVGEIFQKLAGKPGEHAQPLEAVRVRAGCCNLIIGALLSPDNQITYIINDINI